MRCENVMGLTLDQQKVCVGHGSLARNGRLVPVSLDVFGCGVGCGITSLADVKTTIICNPITRCRAMDLCSTKSPGGDSVEQARLQSVPLGETPGRIPEWIGPLQPLVQ